MREIKFRAFVKNMKWLLPVTEIHFGECGYVEVDYTGEGDYADYDFDEVQLMQFTGLKDKNGREIYEGDIVKGYYDEYDPYFAETNRHQFTSDVKYIDNSFKVHRNTVNDEGRIRDYGYLHHWDSETVEIIGNIYEHKHLLEGDAG